MLRQIIARRAAENTARHDQQISSGSGQPGKPCEKPAARQHSKHREIVQV